MAAMQEIKIPLGKVGDQTLLGTPDDYFQVIHDDYAARYLATIGVDATPINKQMVMRNMPLKDCEITASWSSRTSAVADYITVLPPQRRKVADTAAYETLNKGQKQQWYGLAEQLHVALPKTAARTIVIKDDAEDEEEFSLAANAVKTAIADQKKNRDAVETKKELESQLRDLAQRNEILSQVLQKFGWTGTGSMPAEFMDKLQELDSDLAPKRTAAALQRKMQQLVAEGGDDDLEKEFLKVRKKQSGTDTKGAPVDELGEERQKRREKELELLKQKFILPFCCEHPAAEGGGTVLTSWHQPHLQGELKLEVPDLLRQEVLQPINVTLDDIRKELSRLVMDLPLELLTARRHEKTFYEELRGELGSTRIVRLAGLISHFLYWNIFGFLHKERQLPETSKQSLFLTIHELWSSMEAGHKENPLGVSYVIPVSMLTLKWTVERCFGIQYPKFTADNALAQSLIDRTNVLFMRLFDPDCRFARFGAFDGTLRAIKLTRKLGLIQSQNGQGVTRRSLNKQHRATPLVHSVMKEGGCIDPKTRALFERTTKTPKTIGVRRNPSPPSPVVARRPQQEQKMDEWKRIKLFNIALSRLQPAVEDDLATPLKSGASTDVKLPSLGKSKTRSGALSAR